MNRLQHLAPIIASLLTFLHLLSFDVPASVGTNLPSATFFYSQLEQLLARGDTRNPIDAAAFTLDALADTASAVATVGTFRVIYSTWFMTNLGVLQNRGTCGIRHQDLE